MAPCADEGWEVPPVFPETVRSHRRWRQWLRRQKPALVFTGALLGIVLLLAGLVSLIPPALPAVAPVLSRLMFGAPDDIWAYFIGRYNTGYNLDTSAHFTATLAVPFAPGADLSILDEWATMRQVDGEVISHTLTLEDHGSAPVRTGLARVRWRSGRERCFRVAFLNMGGGYLIDRISSVPCPGGN